MAKKKTATKRAPTAGGNQGGVLDSSELFVYLTGVTAHGSNGERITNLSRTGVPGQRLIRFKPGRAKDLIAVVGRNTNKDFSVFLSAVPKPKAADK
jgi:hypothetical protein